MALLKNVQSFYLQALQDQAALIEKATAAVQAADVLTLTINPADGKVVTLDGKVYTFQTVLTDVDGHVLIGVDFNASLDNLSAAINLGSGAGSLYAASTTAHPTLTSSRPGSGLLGVAAQAGGVAGNSIAVSTNISGATWASPTLTGGIDSGGLVRDNSIIEAVGVYNRRLPLLKTIQVTSNPAGLYSVPADWIDGVSKVVAIRFPFNTTPPEYINPRDWEMLTAEDSALQYFISINPQGVFRLLYLAKHGATTALPSETLVGSIPTEHEAAVGKLAASIAALSYATFYGQTTKGNVDSINYRTKEQEWRDLSKALREQVDRELRVSELDLLRKSDPVNWFKAMR